MKPQLTGLSPLDVELCQRLWEFETLADIEAFTNSLPRSLRHRCKVLLDLIIIDMVDQAVLDSDLSLAQTVIANISNT